MKIFTLFSLIFIVSNCSSIKIGIPIENAYVQKEKTCDNKDQDALHVWIFKQWHLPPNLNTFPISDKSLPQFQNQRAIYSQIYQWVKKGLVTAVYAEGCEGPIDKDFPLAFNGWDFDRLSRMVDLPDYGDILSHVPLKLKVKFGKQLQVQCADSMGLIRDNQEYLSKSRGLLGFYARIKQFRKSDPKKANYYLAGVRQALSLKEDISMDEAIPILKSELQKSIRHFREGLEIRNLQMVKSMIHNKSANIALVVGAAHANGLLPLLNDAKISCTILKPRGLMDESAELILSLENEIHKL